MVCSQYPHNVVSNVLLPMSNAHIGRHKKINGHDDDDVTVYWERVPAFSFFMTSPYIYRGEKPTTKYHMFFFFRCLGELDMTGSFLLFYDNQQSLLYTRKYETFSQDDFWAQLSFVSKCFLSCLLFSRISMVLSKVRNCLHASLKKHSCRSCSNIELVGDGLTDQVGGIHIVCFLYATLGASIGSHVVHIRCVLWNQEIPILRPVLFSPIKRRNKRFLQFHWTGKQRNFT